MQRSSSLPPFPLLGCAALCIAAVFIGLSHLCRSTTAVSEPTGAQHTHLFYSLYDSLSHFCSIFFPQGEEGQMGPVGLNSSEGPKASDGFGTALW